MSAHHCNSKSWSWSWSWTSESWSWSWSWSWRSESWSWSWTFESWQQLCTIVEIKIYNLFSQRMTLCDNTVSQSRRENTWLKVLHCKMWPLQTYERGTHWFTVAECNMFKQLASREESSCFTHSLWYCWRCLTARHKHFSWLIGDYNHCRSFAFATLS